MSADLNDVEAMDRRLRSAAARVRDAEEHAARLRIALDEVEAGARLFAAVIGGGVVGLVIAAWALDGTAEPFVLSLIFGVFVALVLAGGSASLRSLGRAS